MKTQVITLVQHKGGVGKTTTVQTIGSSMDKDGAKVVFVDTDKRWALYRWAMKDANEFSVAKIEDDEKLMPSIQKLKSQDYDAVIIDTAGYKSATAIYAIGAADLVLIPVMPDENSALDAVRTYNHVNSVAMNMGKEIQVYALMVNVNSHANITEEIRNALIFKKIPLLDTMVESVTGFREMQSLGTGPVKTTAVRETKKLMGELQRKGLLWYYTEEGRWATS
ncbi:AAA family ATPase [Marinicella sp. W31]|uniref:AAA family ATPase n=1 Tax=Marinicella sp. W31 TaxID=3023713 RepID=UPI0037568F0D